MSMMGKRGGFTRCLTALRTRQNRQQGMTIIEILVVIAIIGLLVAILMPVLTKVRETAKMRETQILMSQIAQSITTMRDHYNYDDLFILDSGAADLDLGAVSGSVTATMATDDLGGDLLTPDLDWFNILKELAPQPLPHPHPPDLAEL